MKKRYIVYISVFINLYGVSYYVAPWGDDDNPGTFDQPWATIQKAANTLYPGDTVFVREGVYNEKIEINVSGYNGDYVIFINYPGEIPIIDGDISDKQHVIYMNNKSYIKIIGFNIRNNEGGSGIFIEDGGDYIEIKNNVIYNMFGPHGMGITVYAHSSDSITNIKIENTKYTIVNQLQVKLLL